MAAPDLGDFSTSVLLARFEGLNVFGLYMPCEERKRPVFDFLLNLPGQYLQEDTILIGDWNTGRHHEAEAGATFTRYFSDKQCGGPRKALKAAEAKLTEMKEFLEKAPRKNGKLTRAAEAKARKLLQG